MSKLSLCSFVLGALLCSDIVAAADADARTELEAGTSFEYLTNNLPDWQRYYLDGIHRFDARRAAYGGMQAAERFNRDDTEAYIGAYQPLGPRTIGVIEATVSGTHDIFPEWSLFGQVEQALPAGWGIHLGYRHRAYTDTDVETGTLTLERYWSSYRGAYSYSVTDLEGDREGSHRLQFGYYYGERSSIGVSYVSGRELESTQATPPIVIFDVRYYAIAGRHWFNDRWAVSYAAEINEQGDSYTRRGLSLGIRRVF